MRRVLFRWRGLTVWSYPAFLYLGLVAGVVVGNVAAHAAGPDARGVFAAQLILIGPALVGARLLHVATHWPAYRGQLRQRLWNRREGGAAHYGGLAVALVLSPPLLAALRVPLGAFWDVTALSALVTLVFARVGCRLNGCCAGRLWRGRRLPAQLLEAAWASALAALAAGLLGRLPFPGASFLVLAASYASGRLLLLFARAAPVEGGARRLTVHQGISLAMIVVSIGALTLHWRR